MQSVLMKLNLHEYVVSTEATLYHLGGVDRGQAEAVERDEEALQLSNQQQQNDAVSKLDRKHRGSRMRRRWNLSLGLSGGI